MYSSRTMSVMFSILLSADGYPCQRDDFNHRIQRRGAWAYSMHVHVKCFSADSTVRLISGEEKQINQIQAGDQLITIENNRTVSTEMIMMLDQHIARESLFYTLTTQSGHSISLTKYHLISIQTPHGKESYRFAKDIQLGDYLYILGNNTVHSSVVIDIQIEIKTGYYAPLTMKGTLLINQILSSCFALIANHHLAQMSMFPFRLYYSVNKLFQFNDPFDILQNSEGLPWPVQIMFDFARYFSPQIFLVQ